MRTSRPCSTWNALTASNAVASTPTQPRVRIHHANSATAAIEQTTDGRRSHHSLVVARDSGARRR